MAFVGRPVFLGALVFVFATIVFATIGVGVLAFAGVLALALATLTVSLEVDTWATTSGVFRFAEFLRRSPFVDSIMM